MTSLKTAAQLELMARAGKIVGDTLKLLEELVKPGITTKELDAAACAYITKQNAAPSFLGYHGYPASICASVDEQVIHGIPGSRRLLEGEIVSIDIGAIYKGWHGDAARTFPVGKVSAEKQRLMDVTRECFFKAAGVFKDGSRLGDIGYAVQSHAEANGFSAVRKFVGHGIGTAMHEDPQVPNFGTAGRGQRLATGTVLAIEPMINMGDADVKVLSDGWTVVTADGKPSAHYENTVALTDNGIVYFTL